MLSALLVWVMAAVMPQAPASARSTLDFEYFRTKVQPIFLTKRPGHARCIACHIDGTPMRLSPMSSGAMWNMEESRKNFEVVSKVAVKPGDMKSILLMHPLAEKGGGDIYHNGGKHWASQNEAEWQTLAAWVRGEKVAASSGR